MPDTFPNMQQLTKFDSPKPHSEKSGHEKLKTDGKGNIIIIWSVKKRTYKNCSNKKS